jgi:hypothetical protein
MFRTAARFLLLRFLPRRIVPIVTVVEAVLLVRSLRRRPATRAGNPAGSPATPPRSRATRGKRA